MTGPPMPPPKSLEQLVELWFRVAAARRRSPAAHAGGSGAAACAADPRTFLGCYSFPNHVLAHFAETNRGIEIPSAVDALRAELPGVEVVHQAGSVVTGADRSGFAADVHAAGTARPTPRSRSTTCG